MGGALRKTARLPLWLPGKLNPHTIGKGKIQMETIHRWFRVPGASALLVTMLAVPLAAACGGSFTAPQGAETEAGISEALRIKAKQDFADFRAANPGALCLQIAETLWACQVHQKTGADGDDGRNGDGEINPHLPPIVWLLIGWAAGHALDAFISWVFTLGQQRRCSQLESAWATFGAGDSRIEDLVEECRANGWS